MIVRITADKKGALNFITSITSKLKYQTTVIGNDQLLLKGKARCMLPIGIMNRNRSYMMM